MLYPTHSAWHFPDRIYRLLIASTQETRADIAMGIAPLMGTLSGLAQGKFEVRVELPQSSLAGYSTQLSTYWLCTADSSAAKGPTFKKFMAPITALVATYNAANHEEHQSKISYNASLEVLIKAKRRALVHFVNEELTDAMFEISLLEKQKMPVQAEMEFSTLNVTAAALAHLLETQEGSRVTILDPEGASLRSILEDRWLLALFNQGYDGEEIKLNRLSRPSTRVAHPHLSLGIMLQPDKLKQLSRYPQAWGEGLLPRIMPVFPLSLAGSRVPLGTAGDPVVLGWYTERLRYLFQYPWSTATDIGIIPHTLHLHHDAFQVWWQCASWLEQQQSPGSPLVPLSSWLGKAATATVRIAALYHLLDGDGDPVSSPISKQHMEWAVSLIQTLIPHVQTLHSVMFPNHMKDVAKKIKLWLLSHIGTKTYFTLRELYRAGHRAEEVLPIVTMLVQAQALFPWTEYEPNAHFSGVGRPKSQGFGINFAVLQSIDF